MYEELVKRLRNCATQAAPCKTCDMIEDGSCSNTLMKQAADTIEKLQADARPVIRGKWTLNKDGSGTCSECGFVQNSCWDLDGWDNFCHHCGADMRGEKWTQIVCKRCGGKKFIAQDGIVVCDKCGARMDGEE